MSYPIGEWVESELGPILAFDSFQNAKAFAISRHYIWLAEAKDVSPVEIVLSPTSLTSPKTIKEFWQSDDKSGFNTVHAPRGTVGCQRIRLVEMVARGNIIFEILDEEYLKQKNKPK